MWSVQTWRILSEPTGTDAVQNRSRNAPEHWVRKPGTHWELSDHQTNKPADSDQEESSHMVTGVQEEFPYGSNGISLGKQKKARSTSQPQFRREKTFATIEADQILLAFSNCEVTAILPISKTTWTNYQNCPIASQQQCPLLTGSQKIWVVWRFVLNGFWKSQSTHTSRQGELLSLYYALRCVADV